MGIREKVALINAPSNNKYFTNLQPPVGLLYIASYLRENGIDVFLADLNTVRNWGKKLTQLFRDHAFTTVGISSNVSNYDQTLEIASLVKTINSHVKVVVGGPHPTVVPEEYMHSNINYIIPFEGEQVLLDLIRTSDGVSVEGVISCRKGGCDISLARMKRRMIPNLDDLPFPAYDMIDVRPYYTNTYRKRPLVSMITSRGCPHQCIFCSQSVSGRRWRARSAENVVEEMKWLQERIGVKEISIEDDNFTCDMNRVFEICDLMQSRGLKIIWQVGNGIRADRTTKKLLKAMKDAGCWRLALAPEVGDEEDLKKIRKGMTLDQFRQAAQWCNELGIVYHGFFSMGFPFQDKESMEKTIHFAMELDPLLMDLSKIIPFPGTELFKQSPDRNRYKNNISYFYNSGGIVLDEMFKKAYFKFYLRPRKLFKIIKTIGFRQFFAFVLYAINVFLFNKSRTQTRVT